MARICIIGGTGFISQRLVLLLLDDGHQVTLLNRGISPSPFKEQDNLQFHFGDRNDPAVLKSVFDQTDYDVVYDFVGYTPDQVDLTLAVLGGSVDRYIFCSTVSVYMISHDVSCPITEDQDHAPLMESWPRNPFGYDYGVDKRQCEDVIWRAHDKGTVRATALRPTFVAGPGDPLKREWFWLQRILDSGPVIVPGSGEYRFQNVYVEDVARAFMLALNHSNAIGQSYNVVGEESCTLNEYLDMLGAMIQRPVEKLWMQQVDFDKHPLSLYPDGDVFPYNTRRDAVFSQKKIQQELGYRSTPRKEWIAKTLDWFMGGHGGDSIGYERRNEDLALCQQLHKEHEHVDQ